MATASESQPPSTPTNPRPTHKRSESADIDIEVSSSDHSLLERNGVSASQDSMNESSVSVSSSTASQEDKALQRSQSEPVAERDRSGGSEKPAIEKITASTEAELLAKLEQQNK